jgi:segregation and condensation protein A
VFEGPLDLLLYLIRKEEVDIYNIPIHRITNQYMEYLSLMKMLDLNIAGEFIVMAATLMMIKSRMLLPVEEREAVEEEEEDDPRWDLVRQLVEYKKFKDAALRLEELESVQENRFGLGGENAVLSGDDSGLILKDIGLFDLIAAFNEVLKRAPPEQMGEIVSYLYTVADKIDAILRVVKSRATVLFSELFRPESSRHEIVCTFLALLELIRLRQVAARQRDRFGEIVIVAVDEPDASGGRGEAA